MTSGSAFPLVRRPRSFLRSAHFGNLVEPDIFQSGEAAFCLRSGGQATTEDRVTTVASVVFHISADTLLIFSPKTFPPHARSNEEKTSRVGR